MTIRDMVSSIVQEFHLENYQVRELPGKTITNLDAKATCVEYSEIAIEDVERKLSNFELDNIHASKLQHKGPFIIYGRMRMGDKMGWGLKFFQACKGQY